MTATRLLLALLIPACASQVDSDDQGTPLATFHGTVSSQRTTPIDAADLAVIWRDFRGPALIAGGIEPVTGAFPSEFQLAIYEPPADNVINHDGDEMVGLAIANIEAVLPGQTEFLYPAPQALGVDREHVLVYVPQDVPADSFPAAYLHDTPKAGFHIYGVRPVSREENLARESCMDNLVGETWRDVYMQCGGRPWVTVDVVPLATDLDTQLSVTLSDDVLTGWPIYW